MKMKCPSCGVSGTVADSLIGRKVKCPKCNEIFTVAAEENPFSPEDAAYMESALETPGRAAAAGSSSGIVDQDEASLEEELAKIFEDMKRSTPTEEPEQATADTSLGLGHSIERNTGMDEVGLSEEELESELEDIMGDKCSVCGTDIGRATKYELNGVVYCANCLPETDSGTEEAEERDLTVSEDKMSEEKSGGVFSKILGVLAGIVVIGLIVYAAYYFTQM